MNKNSVLLYEKLFGRINHHQSPNEYVLHNFYLLSNNCSEQLIRKKKKYAKIRFLLESLNYVINCSM